MTLPTLTPEQRATALARAAQVRKARAEIKAKLKSGTLTLSQVLEQATGDVVVDKLKVSALLESLPKVGRVKAQELMEKLDIAPTRRVGGLGQRQRQALIAQFSV